jgi:hypothetical protein
MLRIFKVLGGKYYTSTTANAASTNALTDMPVFAH